CSAKAFSFAAASFSCGALRATTTTRAPAAPRRCAMSKPMPRDPPVMSAVLSARSAASGNGAVGHGQAQEFLAGPYVFQENAAHRARDCLRVLLLDAAHHHTQVVRFHDHAHAEWLQHFPQRL